MRRAGSCPQVRPVGHEPAGIYSFSLLYTDGNRLFNAKPTIRFRLARISGPPVHVESIRALLAHRSKNLLEIVRSSYLPRLKSQPQRTRRDWENLFHLAYIARIGRIVENRDTGKFGNGFFEQLQPLTA